ncbi:UDP-glucose/GDP-mannose dehydrogenase family protein [Mesobacillus sp. AQ2]|uniref:UDP-glucose dehydrogenase family protein n=1 Tax=Mesobacillus sp. AQ2 TaxID=3043332 RepID=UPI0024C1B044|nr:UDP-glucose/GDP-mannose dehydrogenase family protein [Mesobacillus sp. AQ2]WHX40262.1 UDP-glucose/GDP-mannose dehydrogenase family protein [Mesobacillus sp. AQ2]
MKLAVVGTGYVGLVSGVCFSDLGNEVICVDKDPRKIDTLNRLESPIYEPGLKELIEKNYEENRLKFTTDLSLGVKNSDIIIIAVGTPPLPNGEANLEFIEQVAREIAEEMDSYKVVITKSTVPVGTNERIRDIIKGITSISFDVVSVPEFLREGSAVKDTFNPDRIIIGTESEKAKNILVELHKPLTENIIVTDIRSAEMIKYASNAFLATKISFINEIANICDKVGADVTKVAEGMGFDNRIGKAFLNAGIGYGGSCFPKDTNALVQIAGNANYDFKLLKAVIEVNQNQRFNVLEKLKSSMGSFSGKTVAIWGLAFKPNTDDVRDAPAFEVIDELIKGGATVKAFDPVAMENFKAQMNHPSIVWCNSGIDAAAGSDAICLLTEWNEFKEIDLNAVQGVMKTPVLIDGRNVYSKEQINLTEFKYKSIGRPELVEEKEIVTL